MIVIVKPKPNNPLLVSTPITALAQMNDVAFVGLADNDILKQIGGKWTNSPIGSDANFTFNQGLASSTWTITHNLNKFPSCTIIDSAGDGVEGDIAYTNNNQLVIQFSAAFSGKAYLN